MFNEQTVQNGQCQYIFKKAIIKYYFCCCNQLSLNLSSGIFFVTNFLAYSSLFIIDHSKNIFTIYEPRWQDVLCCAQSFSRVWLFVAPWIQPTRLLCPWSSQGKNTIVCCHALLQGIFLTQGLNLGFPHCRQTLYCLSHQGSPDGKMETRYSTFSIKGWLSW